MPLPGELLAFRAASRFGLVFVLACKTQKKTITPLLQAMLFTSCRDGRNTAFYLQGKKGICDRQAAMIMKAHMKAWERNRECSSVKSFDTSLLHGSSTRVETATKWENGRGKGNWKIAGAREYGKVRRSACSAFFFPDSRRLILALPNFCSLYHPFHAFFPPLGFSTVKEAPAEERESASTHVKFDGWRALSNVEYKGSMELNLAKILNKLLIWKN